MVKLTKAYIEKVDAPEKGYEMHWDDGVRGYGLRVSSPVKPGAPPRRTFVAMGRVGGKSIQFTIGAFGTYTEENARKRAQKLLQDMRDGIDPREEKRQREAEQEEAKTAQVTLKEVSEAYFRDRSLKPSSKATIERHVATTFEAWSSKPFLSITREMAKERFREMRDKGLRGKKGAPGQAIQAFSVLRALMNYAMEEYRDASDEPLLRKNPVKEAIKKPLLKTAKDKVLPRRNMIPDAKVGAVWNALDQWRGETYNRETLASIDLVAWMLLTGCRLMEGAALRWENVSLDEKWWHIPDPKNKNPVWLPLSSPMLALLKRRHQDASGDFVFPSWSKAGHIMDPRDVMRKVNGIVETKQKLTNHDLRRSFTHIGYAMCNIDLHKLELLTNHAPQGVTAKHYLKTQRLQYLLPELQRVADWIELEAAKVSGANVVVLSQCA